MYVICMYREVFVWYIMVFFKAKVWSVNLRKFRRITELLKRPKVITLLTFVLTLTVTDTTQTPSQTTRLTLQLPSQSVHTSFRTHQSYHCFYPDQWQIFLVLLKWPPELQTPTMESFGWATRHWKYRWHYLLKTEDVWLRL